MRSDVLAGFCTALFASAFVFSAVPSSAEDRVLGTGFDFFVNANLELHDRNPGDGVCDAGQEGGVALCTLVAGIEEAMALGIESRIHLYSTDSFFRLSATQTISSGDVSIVGPDVGPRPAISTADGCCRAFDVAPGAHLTLRGVDIAFTAGNDGGGGAIRSAGRLDLDHVTIDASSSTVAGGAIEMTDGSIVDSWIHHNGCFNQSATSDSYDCPGGGLHIVGGAVAIVRTTVNDNSAFSAGGGLAIENADVQIVDSTIAFNVLSPPGPSATGGGIDVRDATVEIASSTVARNTIIVAGTPRFGAGLYANGAATRVRLANSIVSHNYVLSQTSFVASSGVGDDCDGAIDSLGYNLVLVLGTTCGLNGGPDLLGVDPQLGRLAATGGATPTIGLAEGSPAIDAGNPAGCATSTGPIATDQRGVARGLAGPFATTARCDVGAYEVEVLFADGFESGNLGAWSSAP